MALTTEQRLKIAAALQRVWSGRHDPIACLKQDVVAAIPAVDDWVEANQAAFNTAIPVAARNALSAQQKAELLYAVTIVRTGRKMEQED